MLYEAGLVLRLRDCLNSRTRSLRKGYVSQDVFSCVYEFQARAKAALFTSLFLRSWGMPRSSVALWNKNTTEGKAGGALEKGLNEEGTHLESQDQLNRNLDSPPSWKKQKLIMLRLFPFLCLRSCFSNQGSGGSISSSGRKSHLESLSKDTRVELALWDFWAFSFFSRPY